MNNTEIFEQQRFRRSPITTALVQMAIASSPGQIITYEKMEQITHASKSALCHYCQSAAKILRRDHEIVWDNQPGVGFKRLSNNEISSVSNAKHVHRATQNARTFGQKLGCTKVNALSPSERHDYSHALVVQSLMAQVAGAEAQKTIKAAIVRDIEIPDFMSLFRGLESA
jgi:hypothetical protein